MVGSPKISLLVAAVITFLLIGSNSCSSAREPVTFLLMVSDDDGTSSAVVSAADKVLAKTNNDLPNHRLEYILSKNQCRNGDGSRALESFFTGVRQSDIDVVAVISDCFSVTEEVAKLSRYFNISVVSYGSSSALFSNRAVYPNFYRTVPSDEMLGQAVNTILYYNNWTQLSIMTEQKPEYLNLDDQIRAVIQSTMNINGRYIRESELDSFSELADVISESLSNLPHIFLPITSHRTQTFILCAAFKKGKIYPDYVWILLGQHDTDWWREYYIETNCTDTDIMTALNRSIILVPYPSIDEQQAERLIGSDLYHVSEYASDAVTALSIALRNCLSAAADHGSSSGTFSSVDDCSGSNLDWSNVAFPGKTGQIRFNPSNGNRLGYSIVIQQYHSDGDQLKTESVALLRASAVTGIVLSAIGNHTIWPDGTPPDGTPVYIINQLSTAIYVTHIFLCGITLICVLVALFFNIIFRKRKIVKLTSPGLNYMLLIGIGLMALSTLRLPTRTNTIIATLCFMNSLFAGVGYNIAISVAIVKTWRIYYLFKNPKPDKKIPKTWQLLLVIGFLGILETAFSIPLLTLALFNNDIALKESHDKPRAINERGVLEIYLDNTCGNSVQYLIFYGLSFAYKIFLHSIALFLTLLIRRVKVDALNDTRQTVFTIYISTIILFLELPVLIFLLFSADHQTIIYSVFIFALAMTHLLLTFVPKMIALVHDPRGEKVFEKIKSQAALEFPTRSSVVTVNYSDDEIAALKKKVFTLEDKLKRKESTSNSNA